MENYLNNIIVTIDGASGSGKEKIAKFISRKYKLYHLDSGLIYRRITLFFIKNKITVSDELRIKKTLNNKIKINPIKHVSLRNEEISRLSSIYATKKIVRDFVNKQQRIIVKKTLKNGKGCVIDGRDIGSKVFKNAKIKLFIQVNVKIRAKRRHKQLIEQGEKSIYSQILKNMKLRDKKDKNRKHSPLVIPKNAFIIDNSKSFDFTKKQLNEIFSKL
ncbi:MAG: Cytidylate kinase [Alphaproteobacteria bacterium MarineAlpha5_Bin9]|nr:MAG: Cytidylate kinase [Alphaproteobacteria bacterium MarineAlpha5_Bin9]